MSSRSIRYIKKIPFKAYELYAKYVYTANYPFFENFERVYHVHLRKCAGTSLNSAFWNLAGYNLKRTGSRSLIINNGFVFVRNHKRLIELGNYVFGNSHTPFWALYLPDRTFVFTMMRDPLSRLLSLHRYFRWIKTANPAKAAEKEPYYDFLKNNIGEIPESPLEFANLLKRQTLEPQLYAFSKDFDVDEALQNLSKINAAYFQDNFEGALNHLSSQTGYNLEVMHERNFNSSSEAMSLDSDKKQQIKELLKDEYYSYNSAKKFYS
jgi:hypothetical protein